ncbi:MAG: hypothetical protein ACHQFW_09110 [Chitinophagales bacterium]
MKKLSIVFFVFLFGASIQSHAGGLDSLKNKLHFELSFGHSLLFISNSKLIDIQQEEAIVVPTSAVLFFTEFRPKKIMRVPVFFNLATETKQFLVDSAIVNEKAATTFGTGLMFRVFQIRIDSTSRIEFEMGPLASCLVNKSDEIKIAPVIAGRFRIARGNNFVMYFGLSYSLGINTLGILYGTGTVF